jgi:hypothetical protein
VDDVVGTLKLQFNYMLNDVTRRVGSGNFDPQY